jgi:nucleoside-diphosphate-sugar epimerase
VAARRAGLGRVLITGGAGFLGVHLANRLRAEGLPVRLLDLAEPLDSLSEGVEYERGDIRDRELLAAAVRDVDAVVHAAFASSRQSADRLYGVNVEGTRAVCEAAVAHGVRRLILISSTIVLKPGRRHPFLASAPLSRLDLYRATRAEGERIVAECGARGVSVALVRPKTFLGPDRVGAFAILFELIRRGRVVPVLGEGRNRYQLLAVGDLTDGIRRLVASDAQGVFHFGAHEFRTVREDLQTLVDHAGTGARLRFVPSVLARSVLRSIELVGITPLAEWHYMSARGEDSIVDTRRAEQELAWRARESNATALVAAYDWYQATRAVGGVARTTHPVTRAHRVLERLTWMLPR